MEANVIDAQLLEPSRLSELMKRSNGPGVRRLVAQTCLYVGTATGLLLARDPWLVGVMLLANGLVQFAMFGMLHESCHRTAFASHWLSLVAGWIAALAQPMTPALMRAFHFAHHRHTHELLHDPELGGFPWMARWPRGVLWPLTMTGGPILFARCAWTFFAATVPAGRLWEAVLPFVRPKERRRVAWEARVLVLVHGAMIAVGVLLYPPILWLFGGMFLGHTFLAWYVTCEHRGLPMEGDVLARTRSLRAPSWLRWLLWNMPYHAEHHAWPAVPWHALPALHAEVATHLVHVDSPLSLHLHGGSLLPDADPAQGFR